MISPAAALAYLVWRFYAGAKAIAGRHSAPAQIQLQPAQFAEVRRFARLCEELALLDFERIGDYEVRTNLGPNSRQRTYLRAFLSPDRLAYAVVYELVNLTVRPGAQAGAQKVWAELVSRAGESQSLTTSNGDPPLDLHDRNLDRPVQRFPGVPLAELWAEHRAAAGSSLDELDAGAFVERFTAGWTRGFEFQSSHGLYRRLGDRFVATGKLAVRSVLEFHLRLRHRQGPSYAALVMIAVGLGATLMSLAARRPEPEAIPAAAAATGVVFGALFQHFELPGALFVASMSLALHRDDGPAIAAFAFPLILVAALLQKLRAVKAAARLAAPATSGRPR